MKKIYLFSVLSIMTVPGMLALLTSCSNTENKYNDIYKDTPLPNYTVSIEIINPIKDLPVIAQFTPTSGTFKVEFTLGTAGDLEGFKSGTLTNVLTNEGDAPFSRNLNDGNKLEAGKEYTVFARAIGSDGEKYPVGTKSFTVYDSDNSDLKVARHYVSDVSAGFRIDCSEKIYAFRYAFGRQEDRQAFIDNTLKNIELCNEPYLAYYANNFSLEPDTEYVFYCKGYTFTNDETILYEIGFKTDSGSGAPDVAFNYENNIYHGSYTITTNELCGSAIFCVVKQGEHDEVMNGAYNFAGNINGLLIDCATFFYPFEALTVENGEPGTITYTTPELYMDFPLEVYVSIYDKKNEFYCLKRYGAHTPPFDANAGEASVGVAISDITAQGATFDFIPNDDTLGFYFEVYDKEYFEETIAKIDSGDLDKYYIQDELLYQGSWQYSHDPIEPYTEYKCEANKDYYIVVAPMNYNGFEGWGPLNVHLFTTADL